ncbi:lysine decarboxylase [Staphylococcus caeli]|uniref:Orn/Lys/Arg family decarboxylase n=1 Tax=Staphylococcus caeli TaxID=2201815 RepID=UPI003F543A9E
MTLPLTEKLNKLLDSKPISLHVPGHKNMTIGNLKQLKFEMDMTEITGLDDLHQPEEIIAESMSTIKKHPDYDAYYLINGTTSGILSVIQAFSKVSGDYAITRNVHKSVFHALDIANGRSRILETEMSSETKQYIGPRQNSLGNQISNAKLAVFTYPNYYGECFDLKSTLDKMKAYDIPTLIDEAHGAHFGLSGFPESALNFGADYVVQSYHKTLPSLTMSSVIFIHKAAPLREKVLQYLTYFQSSSPSYLLMTSLELAHSFYQTYENETFFKKRDQFIQVIEDKGMCVVQVDDPVKLNVQCKGYTGIELQSLFEEQGIYVELADDQQVLLVLPLWHKDDGFPYSTLVERTNRINIEKRQARVNHQLMCNLNSGIYQSGDITNTKFVTFDESLGKKSAKHIVPYPPGIPMIFRGEIITENMIKLMNYWYDLNIRIEGIKNHKIEIEDE